MRGLTERQRQVLDLIRRNRGNQPSIMEMAAYFGMYPGAVRFHLLALQKKGYIKMQRGKARAILILDPPIPAPHNSESRPSG